MPSTRGRHTRWISDCGKALFFCFPSRRRHTRCLSDWSSDVCSSDLGDNCAHQRVDKVGERAVAVVLVKTRVPRYSAHLTTIGHKKVEITVVVIITPDCTAGEIGRASCRERV